MEKVSTEYAIGERDGRKDAARLGVKPLGDDILRRLYSRDYGEGYRRGYGSGKGEIEA